VNDDDGCGSGAFFRPPDSGSVIARLQAQDTGRLALSAAKPNTKRWKRLIWKRLIWKRLMWKRRMTGEPSSQDEGVALLGFAALSTNLRA
jgi:hypothetical protein